jgi:hypothetical protein
VPEILHRVIEVDALLFKEPVHLHAGLKPEQTARCRFPEPLTPVPFERQCFERGARRSCPGAITPEIVSGMSMAIRISASGLILSFGEHTVGQSRVEGVNRYQDTAHAGADLTPPKSLEPCQKHMARPSPANATCPKPLDLSPRA